MKTESSSLTHLKEDFSASIVVFLVAVPLCLGIALASGAPLFSGIIAGIVGGIVVGAASGSALGVSGPAAGLAVIVLSAITTLGSFRAFLLSVVLAGVMQIALGYARAGVIAYFFPSSVIKGMLTGIGLNHPEAAAARGGLRFRSFGQPHLRPIRWREHTLRPGSHALGHRTWSFDRCPGFNRRRAALGAARGEALQG
jgi:hypothetical protein